MLGSNGVHGTSALAGYLSGDTLIYLGQHSGVLSKHLIAVGMGVDKSGGKIKSVGVDYLLSILVSVYEFQLSVNNAHGTRELVRSGPVDYFRVFYNKLIHFTASSPLI